jgi:hypothetical protein
MGPNRYGQAGSGSSGDHDRDLSAVLAEERERRLDLERRVRELDAQSQRFQEERAEAERVNRIREGLQQRGVRKTDLALRVVREDVKPGVDGELVAEIGGARTSLDEYLDRFVAENPEFLPPRIAGGSGASSGGGGGGFATGGMDLESIRPGMSEEDARRAWREVARLMGHREL